LVFKVLFWLAELRQTYTGKTDLDHHVAHLILIIWGFFSLPAGEPDFDIRGTKIGLPTLAEGIIDLNLDAVRKGNPSPRPLGV
jgi:hypothetical protein